jgi:hypothetical protein
MLVFALIAGRVRAGEADQAIEVNFSQAVQIPGQVLPAGTYWFELLTRDDLHTVRILSADQSKTYAILETINRDRPEPGGTAFTLAHPQGAEPAAVVAWFYPGRTTGHEFLYPKQVEKQLAMSKQETQTSGD